AGAGSACRQPAPGRCRQQSRTASQSERGAAGAGLGAGGIRPGTESDSALGAPRPAVGTQTGGAGVRDSATGAAPPARPSSPAAPPPPAPPAAPPAGYAHTATVWLSPRVVPWLAPVVLALLVLTLFAPWVGTYFLDDPEAYTQTGWGTGFGKELSGLGLVYLLVLLLTVAVAFAHVLVPRLGVRLPPQVQQVWPHRLALLLGLMVSLVVFLLFQLLTGVGLEKAVDKPPTEIAKKDESKPASEDRLSKGLSQGPKAEGARFARLTLYRTIWLYLAVLLQIVALLGVLGEYWLARRGARPLPKLELAW